MVAPGVTPDARRAARLPIRLGFRERAGAISTNQVTNQHVESCDRQIDESGDRRAAFAGLQAWHEGHLIRG
jgi:hypothetical protein